MGIYVFDADVLIEAVTRDAEREGSGRDMGGDIVPDFVQRGMAYVYDVKDNPIPGSTDRDHGYWRDVGTIDSYYDAQMDLISVHPVFNLYNYEWPIYTDHGNYPPAKFVFGSKGRVGEAIDSAVSPGVVISGGQVSHSVLSPGVQVHSYAKITDSVLLDFVDVGRNATIHRAIIDKNVIVPPGVSIGINRQNDLDRGFLVTDSGITVVGKSQEVRP
jgi:ADP-glucose pyrophosphorylase